MRKSPVIAHTGGFELLDARWDLVNGRTVKFRLMESPEKPILMHPFAAFTRRRGGRVGSRFHTVMTRNDDGGQAFNGEVMLMSGGQPLGKGFWVSFWLDDEADHHPFAGCRGRRGETPGETFSAAFVELDDQDQPVDQIARETVERPHQRLSNWAALRCMDPMFLQYLEETATVNDTAYPVSWWAEDERAARWVRWTCEIESRSELDSNPEAAAVFHEKIREPFSDWMSIHED